MTALNISNPRLQALQRRAVETVPALPSPIKYCTLAFNSFSSYKKCIAGAAVAAGGRALQKEKQLLVEAAVVDYLRAYHITFTVVPRAIGGDGKPARGSALSQVHSELVKLFSKAKDDMALFSQLLPAPTAAFVPRMQVPVHTMPSPPLLGHPPPQKQHTQLAPSPTLISPAPAYKPPSPPPDQLPQNHITLITPVEVDKAIAANVRVLFIDLRSREAYMRQRFPAKTVINIPLDAGRGENHCGSGNSSENDKESETDDESRPLFNYYALSNAERALYTERAEYTVTVLYDQNSDRVTPDMERLVEIIRPYWYNNPALKQLQYKYFLLCGGIDSWCDIMGADTVWRFGPAAGMAMTPAATAAAVTYTRSVTDYFLSASSLNTTGALEKLSLKEPAPAMATAVSMITTGLANLGNTCYMNCILQCLVATRQFSNYFLQLKAGSSKSSQTKPKSMVLAASMANLVRIMHANTNTNSVSPVEFKRTCGRLNETFRGSSQQDCQEFLNFVLDELDTELLAATTSSSSNSRDGTTSQRSLITDLVEGQLTSSLECQTCGHTSTTTSTFTSLSVPLPPATTSAPTTLAACLDLFAAPEVLDGDDAWACPKCASPRRALKHLRVSRCPPYLIVHLKRFQYEQGAGGDITIRKLTTLVQFPERGLNLAKYAVNNNCNNRKNNDIDNNTNNTDNTNYNNDNLSGQDPSSQALNYNLYAIANHYGTLKSGHYTAYIRQEQEKQPEPPRWVLFNDTEVNANVAASNVISNNSNAYVLFYHKQN
jgi:ubiquitin C-terminal hydrolase